MVQVATRDNMLIVYRNRKLVGVIMPVILKGQTLYEAVDKRGRTLGKSTIYGEVLDLILKPQHAWVCDEHDEWEENQ
jgi:hypothetical protein